MQQKHINNFEESKTDISTDVEASKEISAMDSTVSSQANTNMDIHSLTDMISRYIFIETFKWNTNNTVLPLHLTIEDYQTGSEKHLKQYLLPQALFDASSLLRQKVNNFMLMKSDIEIDLKVNSTPFQQGELLLAYFPRSLSTSRFRAQGSEFLAAVTTAPHRRLKLEESNSATFRIPYANILDYMNLTDVNNAFGVLNVYVLSTLQGESSVEEVDVTVRLRFVEPELLVPTDSSIMTSSHYMDLEIANLQKLASRKRPKYMKAQMEGEEEGPVTQIANKITKVSDTLSGIPLIGRAATVVGWFSRAVSGVASVFGWSKPIDLTMPHATVAKPAAYMGNTEGKDASCVLAQIPDNGIDGSTMIPSTKDEMDLNFILRKPNIVGRVTVPKSEFTSSKLLFSWEVSPFNWLTQQLGSNGQDLALGSFSFTSLMAKFWRGSITYSLSAIKTGYHSGRIIAIYFPNRVRSEIPETFEELMTTNSNIIYDLTAKSDEEFSLEKPFTVPYTSEEPWKLTLYKNINDLYDSSTLKTCCGVIGVYSVNELVCPPTVAQEVTFLLTVQAGNDYELGLPQIQLQGGFAVPEEPQSPDAELLTVLNREYGGDYGIAAGVQGDNPNLVAVQGGARAVTQDDGQGSEWDLAVGKTIPLDDGQYFVAITCSFSTSLFDETDFAYNLQVQDGIIISLTAEYFPLTGTSDGLSKTTMSFASTPAKMIAQMDDGTSDPLGESTSIANSNAVSTVSKGTTGEYFKSLRPLIKRFVKTCQIDASAPISHTPVSFINVDNQNIPTTTPVGTRAWSTADGTGAYMPESWVSLISYMYRFCNGGVRTKVFIPFDVQATTSLDISNTLYTEFNTRPSDPAFVTQGVVNNAVETNIPYYSQYRARTVGDEARGLIAKQRIELSGTGVYDYYEAAADDFSYFFIVGPPVMRPIDINPVTPPVIAKPARTKREVKKTHLTKFVEKGTASDTLAKFLLL